MLVYYCNCWFLDRRVVGWWIWVPLLKVGDSLYLKAIVNFDKCDPPPPTSFPREASFIMSWCGTGYFSSHLSSIKSTCKMGDFGKRDRIPQWQENKFKKQSRLYRPCLNCLLTYEKVGKLTWVTLSSSPSGITRWLLRRCVWEPENFPDGMMFCVTRNIIRRCIDDRRSLARGNCANRGCRAIAEVSIHKSSL